MCKVFGFFLKYSINSLEKLRNLTSIKLHLMILFLFVSFACAKERTKEKHTGNDIQPLPDAVI